MSKRNKAKIASKTRKSALRIEALEQRQLLATITGSGTEVGSNIVHPNGNVYDQVLMTGSSVTVTSDAGQVTRISYLDLSGDIVQAEFSGKGTLTVSLDQFGAAAAPANYNQPGVQYVKGLASFTVQGSDATTNFSVFSVGSGNAVNQALFTGGKTGGNNIADVARLTIVSDPTNPGGFSNFGSILAGNAVFSADSGTVGIAAANVNVQGTVRIGDINALNAGVPTLTFGNNSQFATLQVAGGDLVNANNAKIANNGFASVNFTAGATSVVPAGGTPNQTAQVLPAGGAATLFNSVGTTNGVVASQVVTLDSATLIDLAGKSQADLNTIFNSRTFANDLTITGDLAAGTTIKASGFGNVTFSGNVAGSVLANQFGNVTLTNLSGVLGTDEDDANDADTTENGIGNVTITGNVTGNGQIESAKNIGTITVNGNVTGGGSSGLGGFTNAVFVANGNIASLTVKGDVNLGAATRNLVAINNGVYGNISIEGGGSLGNLNSAINLGVVSVNDLLAGIAVGTYTAVETTADVNFGGILTDADTDDGGTTTLGAISITVGGSNASPHFGDLTVSGRIGDNATTGTATTTIGTVTLTSSTGNVTLNGEIGAVANAVGAVTISAGTNVTINQDVVGGNVGAYSVTAGTLANTTGTITIADDKGIAATGNASTVTLTANGDITMTSSAGANFSARNIGAVTIGGSAKTASITFTSNTDGDAAFLATGGGYNSIGAVTLNGRVVGGTAAYEFQASSIGNIVVDAVTPAGTAGDAAVDSFGAFAGPTRAVTTGGALATDFAANTDDTNNANGSNLGSFKIGDITVTQSYSNSAPNAVDVLFKGDNLFVATGSIGTVTVTGTASNSNDAKLFNANTDALVLHVGDVNGNLTGAAGTGDVNYTAGTSAIGNINITAAGSSTTVTDIGGANADDATGFSGLTVMAGVHLDNTKTAALTNATSAGLVAADKPIAIGSGTYAGTIGNVMIKSYTGTLAVNQGVPVGLANFTAGGTNDRELGGIFAKTSVGTLQGTAVSVNTLSSGVLIGPSASNLLTGNNILVYVL